MILRKRKQVDKGEKQPSQNLQQSAENNESKVDKPKKVNKFKRNPQIRTTIH